jgi:hypothetical protein
MGIDLGRAKFVATLERVVDQGFNGLHELDSLAGGTGSQPGNGAACHRAVLTGCQEYM